jgi:Predicted metal-dependent enzyme
LSKNKKEINSRLNTVGGQAVLEGVMMKSKEQYSVAVRKEDGTLSVKSDTFTSVRKKIKILNIPIIRGVVNFVETMILSFKTLMMSAEAMGLEELEDSKFEKWLNKHFGKSIMNLIMVISTILGLALGMGLFFFLPIFITKTIDNAAGNNLGWFKNLIEGLLKIIIFIAYLWAVSLMKDIRRTFEYHGAEHKSIFCYESGEDLTPENVKKFVRFHPRCGTSFLFIMLFLSIIVFSLPFITWDNMLLRMVTKIALLPIIVGIGYEIIMYAGKNSDNIFIKIVSAPGLWIQRITTREPDLDQIEVAIAALKSSMPSEFPDFKIPEQISEETIENVTPEQGTV